MKIIIIGKNKVHGYNARFFGRTPLMQTFASTEVKALELLIEKFKTSKEMNNDEEFEQQEKADREADDYLLEIIMNK